MAGFSPLNLSQRSTDSASPSKDRRNKVDFTHYGFLTFEGWCAYGLPPTIVESSREKLTGPCALAYCESVLAHERSRNPVLTGSTQLKDAKQGVQNREDVLKSFVSGVIHA